MVTPATLPSPARGATDLPSATAAATKRSEADPASSDDFGDTIDQFLGDKTGVTGIRTHTPPAETIEPAPEASDAATILNRANPGVRNHQPPEELAEDTTDEAQPASEPTGEAKSVRPHAPPTELESSDAAPATTNATASSTTRNLASAAASIGVRGFSAKQRVQSLLIDAEKADGKGPTGKRFSAQG